MNKFVIGGVNYKDGNSVGVTDAIYSVLDSIEDLIKEYNKRYENQIISYEVWNNETRQYDVIEVEKVECIEKKYINIHDKALRTFSERYNNNDWEVKEVQEVYLPREEKSETTLYEATSLFMSKADIRNFVLDNREIYEGYIIRSLNGWDSDTIYRWKELDNGNIIWRKEKA